MTSAAPDDGKTITASNLAVAFAQAGRPTILVDADLRKPGVHLVFQATIESGLTTLLRDDGMSVDQVAQVTEQPNLRIVTTGPLPPNPAELLGSHRMRAVVDQLMAAADLVIFDAPPVRAVADALVMSSYLDATLLVVNAERTRRDALRQGRDALARAGANLLGVVLNRVPKSAASSYYGYGYFDNKPADPPTEHVLAAQEATAVSPTTSPEAAPYRQASAAGDPPARRAAPKQS